MPIRNSIKAKDVKPLPPGRRTNTSSIPLNVYKTPFNLISLTALLKILAESALVASGL